MMRSIGLLLLVLFAAIITPSRANAQEADPRQVIVKVRIAAGARGLKIPAGSRVELVVMYDLNKSSRLSGLTDERGAAAIAVPAPESAEKPTVCLAAVDCLGTAFYSEPFRLTPGQTECEVEIRVIPPPAVLPRWSYAALAVIFLAAIALVAARPSDRRLAE